jgi:hypothetical protein
VSMADKVQRLSDPGSKTSRRRLSWRRVSEHLDRWIRSLACLAGVAEPEIERVRDDLSSISAVAASRTHPDLSAQLDEILNSVRREERMWQLDNRADDFFTHLFRKLPRPKPEAADGSESN